METWGGDKEVAVTAQNLHLIVTALQSSKYLSIQWKVTSFELIELSNSDSHIKETKGGENVERSHEGGGEEGEDRWIEETYNNLIMRVFPLVLETN